MQSNLQDVYLLLSGLIRNYSSDSITVIILFIHAPVMANVKKAKDASSVFSQLNLTVNL